MSDNGGFWRPIGVGRVTDEGLDHLARWIGAAGACAGIGPDVVLELIEEVRAARAEIARLTAEREALYRLCWKWGFDREEGTYHPDNPPADYGPWAIPLIRQAAGIDPSDWGETPQGGPP